MAAIAHIIHFILRNVSLSKELDIEMYKSLELKYLKMNILNSYYHDIHFSYNIIHLQIRTIASATFLENELFKMHIWTYMLSKSSMF